MEVDVPRARWELCPHFTLHTRCTSRLTQMLAVALGPPGPDGLFRAGLEAALQALRGQREGVAALLDAVLGDPGVEWSAEREDAAARCGPGGCELCEPWEVWPPGLDWV